MKQNSIALKSTSIPQILQKAALKVTPVRTEVIQVFLNYDYAMTSAEVEKQLGSIDRITLYRTIKSFEEKGIIHKIASPNGDNKYALCDVSTCSHHEHHDHHVHFHCDNCNQTYCIEETQIPSIKLPNGYTYYSASMIINGKCQKCSANG